jgi:glycerol kinase
VKLKVTMATNSHKYILALDLGTTGNRAILFDKTGNIAGQVYREFTQHYPQPGWLEHDPLEMWRSTRVCMEQVFTQTGVSPTEVAAIGLTVQRETCLLWDRNTDEPLHRAIVWQDRRTAPMCRELTNQGYAEEIQKRTGLVLDSYFSATKIAWLIDKVKAEQPDLDFEHVLAGTVDAWILWQLTGSKVHATDHSNASRTMLMNIETQEWDEKLLDLFNIPASMMPEIRPSLGYFGETTEDLLGVSIPIMAIFGDQQASLYAHGCDRAGMLKCTYGTGCFLITQTEQELTRSRNQLLSTVAWTNGVNGKTTTNFALEGAMFTTGASIQWLRDGAEMIQTAAETQALCESVSNTDGVFFVPALSGLGAPHWDMSARGAFFGITGGVKREHMVRAVLESIAYQVKEVTTAMNRDGDTKIKLLKVDGGASKNDFLMQFQADALGITVERPKVLDATAQGAAFGAGLAVGFWDDYQKLVDARQIDRTFEPGAGVAQANDNFVMWQKAVERAKNWVE